MKGRLIVIEGLDGSGKSTQLERLISNINSDKIHRIKLPDYESDSSALVRMYLNGDFGRNPSDVNAYAASSFYAVDRYAHFKTKWAQFYNNGDIIIADRYTTSNAYHQAIKIDPEKRASFYNWLETYEYELLGIPRPDAVIYLDMPVEISQRMMSERYKGDESKKDIHESNTEYLTACREVALDAAEKMGWTVIKCNDGDRPRTIDDIAGEIFSTVKNIL